MTPSRDPTQQTTHGLTQPPSVLTTLSYSGTALSDLHLALSQGVPVKITSGTHPDQWLATIVPEADGAYSVTTAKAPTTTRRHFPGQLIAFSLGEEFFRIQLPPLTIPWPEKGTALKIGATADCAITPPAYCVGSKMATAQLTWDKNKKGEAEGDDKNRLPSVLRIQRMDGTPMYLEKIAFEQGVRASGNLAVPGYDALESIPRLLARGAWLKLSDTWILATEPAPLSLGSLDTFTKLEINSTHPAFEGSVSAAVKLVLSKNADGNVTLSQQSRFPSAVVIQQISGDLYTFEERVLTPAALEHGFDLVLTQNMSSLLRVRLLATR